ncbi:MAG: dienelactone hydrolase family protein [Alphaproteobacteria bacterium]|nr:dienelactone hydrolase family protein [Alphaproteobacteria bacterium]
MASSRETIRGKDGSFSAYVAAPKNKQAPSILVIQEIFGVNQVMRDICDSLAEEGYWAVCPDLFWRIEPGIDITDKTDAEWEKAFHYFKVFNVDKGVEDIGATLAWIRAQGSKKVGAVGYCLGGLLAYLTACRTDVDCSVGYYGVGIDNYLGEASRVKKPVLLHIAEEDGFVNKESQAKMKAALKPPLFELHSYPGRDHAFAREGGKNYNAADASTANRRTLDFFAKHLK